jgi:hypothetical protein
MSYNYDNRVYQPTDPKLVDRAKQLAASTVWIQPPFAEESEEVERTAKQLGIPVRSLVNAWSKARLETLTDDVWESMENTDSYGLTTFKEVDQLAQEYDRNITWTLERFGSQVPAPVVLARRGKPLYLIGGNTRLMLARVLGAVPKVWTLRL